MQRRLALLIGSREFEDKSLHPLTAPWNDVVALSEALRAHGDFAVDPQVDLALQPAQVKILKLFKDAEPDDLILFYYTGHGLRDKEGELYLALRETESSLPEATALSARVIREAMDSSAAQSQVWILDCCHAGAAMKPGSKRDTNDRTLVKPDLVSDTLGSGRYVLAASKAGQSAFEDPEKRRSIYTHYLVDALATGRAAPDKDHITVNDLHLHLRRQVTGVKEAMQPEMWVEQQTEPLRLSRNPDPTPELDPSLVDLLYSEDLYQALGAASVLARKLDDENPRLVTVVETALRSRLSNTDGLLHDLAVPIQEHLEQQDARTQIDELVEQLNAALEEKEKLEKDRTAADEAARKAEASRAALEDERDELSLKVEKIDQARVRVANSLKDSQDKLEAERLAFEKRLESAKKAQRTGRAIAVFWPFVAGSLLGALAYALLSASFDGVTLGQTSTPFEPLSTFNDCTACPEMLVIPGGTFTMGSPDNEEGRDEDEGPRTEVTVTSFALARTEVTFDQWQACVDGGGCQSTPNPDDEGWGEGDRPVINVSWEDAQEYIAWLNGQAKGDPYRLPSEAEWEYAARAGTSTAFSFGETISTEQANYDGNSVSGPGEQGVYRQQTVLVSVLNAENEWGLRHMHGNVWEWVEDCWHESYRGRPRDSSSWLEGSNGDCSRRVVRGGSWSRFPRDLRSASRGRVVPGNRGDYLGFRPARTLLPLSP